MIENPPFAPPYKTIVRTPTGAIVTETLADGSQCELGEVPLSSLQLVDTSQSANKQSIKANASGKNTAAASDKAAVYLNVSFADKEKAKSKGARWDATNQKWYAPHGIDINVFKHWWPDSLK